MIRGCMKSDTTDSVIIGIFPPLARTLAQKQNVEFHIRIISSYSNLHDMTNSIFELSKSE